MKKLNDAINILLTTIGERPLAQTVVAQGDSYYDTTIDKLKVYTGLVFENAATSNYTPDGHYHGALATSAEPEDSVVASIVGVFEAELADVIIEEAKTELLSSGYSFNTDTDWPLTPDTTDTITVPFGALTVDATGANPDYIIKEGKLYNRSTQDFTFTEVVLATIIWNTDFDDLQSIAQVVIVNMAKEKMYYRVVGMDETMTALRIETAQSKARLTREEMNIGSYSIYDDGSTNRPMVRTQNPTGI